MYGGQIAYSLDGDRNCLESLNNISNISPNSLSLITSDLDPSRVCLCSEKKTLDCMIQSNYVPQFLYPGQTIFLSAVSVGQDFGTVAGSVYALYLIEAQQTAV